MGILSVDLIILALMMLILMKTILKLLFVADFWLGVMNLNNVKHLKMI